MLSQLVKRAIVQRASVRSFSAMPVRRNAIQDLYVKELKAFKPTPLTAADAEGSVKPWKAPTAPKAPGLEADAATQLSEYENAAVEVDSAPATEGAAESTGEDDWFVLEEDPVEEAHH